MFATHIVVVVVVVVIIHSLFQHMWDQDEMHYILETDENFEIVASTIQCISTKLAVNVQRSTT